MGSIKDNPMSPVQLTYIHNGTEDSLNAPTKPCNEPYDVSFCIKAMCDLSDLYLIDTFLSFTFPH